MLRITYSSFIILVSFQLVFFPVAQTKAESVACRDMPSQEKQVDCYREYCNSLYRDKEKNVAKRLRCKSDACSKVYTDPSQREECQTDESLLEETDEYLNHDSSFDDLYQKSQLFYMFSYLIAIGAVFSLAFGTGLKCVAISGIIGMVNAVIGAVLYVLIILRTNVKLSNLKKALYPNHEFAKGDRSTISQLMSKITDTATPIVNQLKLAGGEYKAEASDGTLKGFQFFIERDNIILDNLKLYRLRVLILLVINTAATIMAAIELIRGELPGKCDVTPNPVKDESLWVSNLIPKAFATERDSGMGEVGDNYSRSYTGSVAMVGIGVAFIIFTIAAKKIPSLTSFFAKIKSFKLAALSRLITYVLYEGFYLIDVVLTTRLISLLKKRVTNVKSFSCEYMNEVSFNFESRPYWKKICSDGDVSYDPAKTTPAFDFSFFRLIKGVFDLKNALAQKRSLKKQAGIRFCLRKNGTLDESCECKAKGACFSFSKLALSGMSKSVRRKYPITGLRQVDQLFNGKDLGSFKTKDLHSSFKQGLHFNKAFFKSAKSKNGNQTNLLPSYDNVKKDALKFARSTIDNILKDAKENKAEGRDFGSLLVGRPDSKDPGQVVNSRGNLQSKAEMIENLATEKEETRSIEEMVKDDKKKLLNRDYLNAQFESGIEIPILSARDRIFEQISNRYKQIYWLP